ncbi:MAG: hypothetical protein F4246_00870 [Rhodothermaceae bacterium]|nr:hypothetical protein [Rhodothermaceae bacterium]MXX59101.1 hypothetical protein [Rhodothermaceae bacterium]MYD20184.1 hypothetical protein [Rhodothermaceae bacterium]MYD55545.1 hypothetical protein [Rhodothermaceae bacterium]
MRDLPRRIMEHASTLQEGTPLCPRALLHMANRTAVDQALSRLARSGELMRVFQGVYLRPIKTRFGIRAPRLEAVLAALSDLWGEIIVPSGGATANFLGLTPQNPIRPVYLTSGPNRELHFGKLIVELRHASRSQLTAPHTKAGDIIRALLWLGPEEVEDHLEKLWLTLSRKDLDELATARSTMPSWMAESVSIRLTNA